MFKRYSLIILLILNLLLTCMLAEAADKPGQKTYPGLPNFSEVAPGIYRGAAPTAEGFKTLESLKVKTIIDLRIERKPAQQEKVTSEAKGFSWINLRMGREAPTKEQVDTLLETLAKAPKEPVYVHCQHGADRTGCMIGIYRVQVQGWTFDETWKEMRKFGFKTYLDELKEAVRSRAKTQ